MYGVRKNDALYFSFFFSSLFPSNFIQQNRLKSSKANFPSDSYICLNYIHWGIFSLTHYNLRPFFKSSFELLSPLRLPHHYHRLDHRFHSHFHLIETRGFLHSIAIVLNPMCTCLDPLLHLGSCIFRGFDWDASMKRDYNWCDVFWILGADRKV